jgi:hypothetical protein
MQRRKGLFCRDCGQRVTLSPAPAEAVVYCQYIDYPPSCVARAGVVLRPRPVARAAVRANTAGPVNRNGGVNRVGVRRESIPCTRSSRVNASRSTRPINSRQLHLARL